MLVVLRLVYKMIKAGGCYDKRVIDKNSGKNDRN